MARYLLLATLLAVLVTALLAWPFDAWIGDAWLPTLALAGGLCLIGAFAGRAVAVLLVGLNPAPEEAPKATQMATAVRLLLTLFLVLPAILMKWVPGMPFVVALGVHYLAQMALEVFVALRELRQNHGPTGTPARHPQPEGNLPTGTQEARPTDTAGAVDDGTGANVQ